MKSIRSTMAMAVWLLAGICWGGLSPRTEFGDISPTNTIKDIIDAGGVSGDAVAIVTKTNITEFTNVEDTSIVGSVRAVTNVVADINNLSNTVYNQETYFDVSQSVLSLVDKGEKIWVSPSKYNWNDVTNAPAFVTETVTNDLASTNWVVSQSYAKESITNELAKSEWVSNYATGLVGKTNIATFVDVASNSIVGTISTLSNTLYNSDSYLDVTNNKMTVVKDGESILTLYSIAGKTYDFDKGSNFTYRLYVTLTNIIEVLGGAVTNVPSFN